MEIEFGFPLDSGEYYDPETRTCYIFNVNYEELIRCIDHAWLHYIIQHLVSVKASYNFDKISTTVDKWDKEIYNLLY